MDSYLGSGRFGTVVAREDNAEPVAVKTCHAVLVWLNGDLETYRRRYTQQLNHEHLAEIRSVEKREDCLVITMPLYELGNLSQYMKDFRPNSNVQLKIMYQCALGLNYLHTFIPNLIHGNIHPGNFLVQQIHDRHVVKLADAGFVTLFSGGQSLGSMMRAEDPLTAYCRAPEVWQHAADIRQSVDVFSLGVVFLAMLNFRLVDTDLTLSSKTLRFNPSL